MHDMLKCSLNTKENRVFLILPSSFYPNYLSTNVCQILTSFSKIIFEIIKCSPIIIKQIDKKRVSIEENY